VSYFLTKYKNTLNLTYRVTSVHAFHIPQNIKLQLILSATTNAWRPVDGELLVSVVHVLDPTVEDSDGLLTVIGYVGSNVRI
jgi:hypothetical protein